MKTPHAFSATNTMAAAENGKEMYAENSKEGAEMVRIVFAPEAIDIKCWSSLAKGTVVVQNADRFGLCSAGVVLGGQVKLLSICYDDENDEFICSDKSPPLPSDACRCYTGQGYSACDCVARATDAKAVVEWFRKNRAPHLGGPILDMSREEAGQWSWWEGWTREGCKEIFRPKYQDFVAMCLSSYSSCEEPAPKLPKVQEPVENVD